MRLTKILCATDFSDGARQAVLVAARMARQTEAELVLVHVWSLPVSTPLEGFAFTPPVIEMMIAQGERGLEDAASLARSVGVERLTTKLLEGVAWDAITRELDADPAFGLAVVGTHGRTGIQRILLGSVAERVVRHAPCSVLAVRPGTEVAPFDHVVCPVDFSDGSRYAVEVAASLAEPGGRGIALVHALELPVTDAGAFTPDFLGDLDRRATAHLEEWATTLRDRIQAPVTTQLRVGAPAGQVLAMLDDDPSYDLVVIGSHGRTGIRRLLLGSVAERIVRLAKAPVFVARRRAS